MTEAKRGVVWLCVVLGAGLTDVSYAQKSYGFKTKHYIIETTVSPDFAEEMGELMEILHAGYSKFFSSRSRSKGLSRVVIYRTRQEYMTVGGGKPNSGGYFSPSEDKIVSWLEHNETYLRTRVLAHEGFHQFFFKCVGTSAPWINEGLAEMFAYSLIDGTDIRYGLVTTMDLAGLKKAMSSSKKLTLKELLTMKHQDWSSNLASDPELGYCEYAQSRFLVHFLRSAYGGKYASLLDRYLKAVGRGGDGVDVLRPKLKDINDEFPKWIDEDLKPECPESCSANLFHLIQVAYQFKKAGVEFDSIEELKEKVKASKDVKWRVIPITIETDKMYGPEHMDVVEKWFVCPKAAGAKKPAEYDLVEDPEGAEGMPMIVCYGHHRKLAVCAAMRKPEGSTTEGRLVPQVWNTQTSLLKRQLKGAKKK